MDSVERYDAVIVGGGHNGLTAAAYLARAGKRVIVLERLDHVGGAAVSERPFAGVDARLSRYSYLVSLLPRRIVDELGLDIRLARRRYSSYTPDPAAPGTGLLVDNGDEAATSASLASIGAAADAGGLTELHRLVDLVARTLWPTVTEPLPTRGEARAAVLAAADGLGIAGDDAETIWAAMTERPIGEAIERETASELVRGVVLTDALIGTFASASDPDLQQNICFLYHLIGGGTGDWDVPIGGMGRVTDELARAAREAGAELVTSAEVTAVEADAGLVHFTTAAGGTGTVAGDWVLSGAAPLVLDRLLTAGGTARVPGDAPPAPEGSQVKVNLLVSRLPRLLDPAVDPAVAFGGTFHVNETWSQLENAHTAALEGRIPQPLPLETYCHSLTDPSILSQSLQDAGAQTLTVFGLHVPHRLALAADTTPGGHDAYRDALTAAALASLESVLAEPLEPLLLRDADGHPCIETKTTLDLERELGMPGGNIFHGPLSWPFLDDDGPRATPAERWGVATGHPRVLLCGAGARRGGAVSGLGGHNAAMAVLEASPAAP